MRRMLYVLLMVAGLILTAQSASAQAIVSWTGGSEFAIFYADSTGDVVGYRFEVNMPVTVDSLGVWDADTQAGGAGLTSDHMVGIWDDTQTLIASTTVTPTSVIGGDFRYEPITPVDLVPGTVYTIGALYTATDDDGYISTATGLVTHPDITWINAVFPIDPPGGNQGFVFPLGDSAPSSQGRFGPNFTFNMTDPTIFTDGFESGDTTSWSATVGGT